ncbi:F-type H+-transporting ATPase subunit epsilon [Microbacteriaceae bacterium SG_E_30_P1]|uniref:ATP synthase epsilon chain n=1 Tax=Antiquaquibacter oligotrophicus TaxID=2880260 RepID=A0ABT6KL32_9MICO|nr:F0F1 ATP synthase subunit epsilon [Antiquaquibacter oligotrophicus]MDH6180559.1 F-type H+-transporting ATPase subunit epsilon [Antiquaquibacter oligotrophicus]UDF13708.1 F0F1 ATP synthase subunit epsilon [Antiquaquibacter oligotrophicus]
MAELTVSVVSADHEVWSGKAKQIIARTTEGEIGILPGHEPLLAILATGEVRVTTVDGSVVRASADDGFLSVEHDTVTVVARDAELATTV